MGPGGRAVEPERAPEPPWRALLESRSLPKEPLGHSPEPNQAQATSSRPPASLHRLRVFLTLEADSDRLLGPNYILYHGARGPSSFARMHASWPSGHTGPDRAVACVDPKHFRLYRRRNSWPTKWRSRMTTCSAPGSATPPRRPACCARTCRRPWPTGCGRCSVTVEESDFVAPELRANESDPLYSIPRRPGGVPACLYVLAGASIRPGGAGVALAAALRASADRPSAYAPL